MHFALIFNRKDKSKLLAQLTLFEDIEEVKEEIEEEGPKSVDGGSKNIRTGFHSPVQHD